jgi:hypothetical protein
MNIWATQWNENGKAGQRSFSQRKLAVEFAVEKVKAPDCGPIGLWRLSASAEHTTAFILTQSHDRETWWDEKTYEGTILKSGQLTRR